MTEEQLAALLHLKRYEQAPPEYFDCLLEDIHRRQRVDLLQLPLWKIAVDRAQTFFSERDTGRRVSPVGALVTAIVIAMAVIGLMPRARDLPRKDAATPPAGLAGGETRYVIDTPPVSYERPSSISF